MSPPSDRKTNSALQIRFERLSILENPFVLLVKRKKQNAKTCASFYQFHRWRTSEPHVYYQHSNGNGMRSEFVNSIRCAFFSAFACIFTESMLAYSLNSIHWKLVCARTQIHWFVPQITVAHSNNLYAVNDRMIHTRLFVRYCIIYFERSLSWLTPNIELSIVKETIFVRRFLSTNSSWRVRVSVSLFKSHP